MISWNKKMAAKYGSAAAGIVIAAVSFVLSYQGSSDFKHTYKDSEPKAVKTTSATQVCTFVDYRKASINEYDMTVTESVQKAKTSKTKSNSKKNLSFTVKMPQQNTKAVDVKNSPNGCYETRSIQNEYYTVHDIISGSTVTLNGHEMLCRMVNSEIGDSWGNEAIKAQVVAAYSYLRFNDSIGAVPTVGLKSGYSSKLESCVNAVEGQAVFYNGNIINAVYSASTAGCSTTSQDIWGTSYPYLQCVKSQYDNEDPNWGIETQLTKEKVKSIIEKNTDIKLSDNIENWFIINSAHSGKYIGSVSIDGHSSCRIDGKDTDITGITLCNLFDIKSNAMDISYKNGVFTFKSYGWGHGVGMSQWGACLYAKHGWTYDQILTHYYLNTKIGITSENSKAVERGKKAVSENENDADAVSVSADSKADKSDSKSPADSNDDSLNKDENQIQNESQSEIDDTENEDDNYLENNVTDKK